MQVRDVIDSVLEHYPADCQPRQVWRHSVGGFSASEIWKLATERGTLCLRRWPVEHPSEERIQFIHAVLWHASQRGFDLLPLPIETDDQASYLRFAGHLWQLEPWLPGEPVAAAPAGKQVVTLAMETLARFHRAVEGFPISDASPGLPRGIVERVQRLAALRDGELDQLHTALDRDLFPAAFDVGKNLLELFRAHAAAVHSHVALRQPKAVPLQPCIRDIWREHVFFEDNTVTGLIDFGACRIDSVAIDIARLLGSLAVGDAGLWRWGLAAYRQIRLLSDDEIHLAEDYDLLSALLSGLQWLQWIFVDRKEFADDDAVLGRLNEHLARLKRLKM